MTASDHVARRAPFRIFGVHLEISDSQRTVFIRVPINGEQQAPNPGPGACSVPCETPPGKETPAPKLRAWPYGQETHPRRFLGKPVALAQRTRMDK